MKAVTSPRVLLGIAGASLGIVVVACGGGGSSSSSAPGGGASAPSGSPSSVTSSGSGGGAEGMLTLSGAFSDSAPLVDPDVTACYTGGTVNIYFTTSRGSYTLSITPRGSSGSGLALGATTNLPEQGFGSVDLSAPGGKMWDSASTGAGGSVTLGSAASGPSGSIDATLGTQQIGGVPEKVQGSWKCPG